MRVIEYLPPILQDIAEYIALDKAENPEIEQIYTAISTVCKQTFVSGANELSVRRYENIFGIRGEGNDLALRRQTILSKMSSRPPITAYQLERLINIFLGEDIAQIHVNPKRYEFYIKMPAVSGDRFKAIMDMVEELKPANMQYTQAPFSTQKIVVKETGKTIIKIPARVGTAIVGKTRFLEPVNEKVVYQV